MVTATITIHIYNNFNELDWGQSRAGKAGDLWRLLADCLNDHYSARHEKVVFGRLSSKIWEYTKSAQNWCQECWMIIRRSCACRYVRTSSNVFKLNLNGFVESPTFDEIRFTKPSARAGYDTRSIFKRSLTGLNSDFFFSKTSCLTKAEEPSLSYYLAIAGGRIIGFIPFPRVLMLCEMQSASSRIWTRVAVSISYDDNHYTTGTSTFDEIWVFE